ncbi:MAG: glycoside hydrolase family 11 protein [Bacteroidales bacterium]|nr:glycoside hydrolase family 11 protein [Bacteroidales bacterium]
MKKYSLHKLKLILLFSLLVLLAGTRLANSQTFCIEPDSDRFAGEKDGFRYELWDQNAKGNACMTLGDGALFSGEWSDIENYLARRGLGYDQTQKHQEIGTFFADYACNYNPSSKPGGNSYLAVYGWTTDPMVEFYIIEDWRNWIPSMAEGATLKDSFYVNGAYYDIYENIRVNQPSIQGITTFPQYFSIRRDTRNSGKINISDHFNKWEAIGMSMGAMYEVSFVVEGYMNYGNFAFTELDVYLKKEKPAPDPCE